MNKLGALWQKKDKNGQTYFSGKVGDNSVVVFKNKNKNADKHPDWIIYESQPQGEKKDEVPF